eukprot:TRINITY_DN11281_c0_g2_i1.p1 TRINITY_DN11281_c0_g2~~TRINITY_DN11281_c0_g2_i1.p1  ORF type:complete len:1049 (+),score=158.07 TRINITY_DN11281_c0_g2_i1:92-3238(+)
MELGLIGGVGAWLYSYNRENFFFDREQMMKREFQSQEMHIKRFELYREDIRDLVELTVAKMENYLIVSTLLCGLCFTLLTEGRAKESIPERWIHFLYGTTTVSAFVYFLLCMWLALHASVAAHSFGVRLLTQFVRLPVPNVAQLDAARAMAKEYEQQSIFQMLKVPILRQQLNKMTEAMDNISVQDKDAAQNPVEDFLGTSDQSLLARSPATSEHMKIYRHLQKNWLAYDAYARVCIFVGANQLPQALSYYCIRMLIAQNGCAWPAVAGVIIFNSCAYLILRLDLYLTKKTLRSMLFVLVTPQLLTALVMILKSEPISLDWSRYLVPVIFAFQLAWNLIIYWVVKADETNDVCLPSRFRTVMYLDVFGWLANEEEVKSGPVARASTCGSGGLTGDTREETQENAANRKSVISSRAADEVVDEMSPSGRRRSSVLPTNLRKSLHESCVRLAASLKLDVPKWEDPRLKQSIGSFPSLTRAIAGMRSRFDSLMAELGELPQEKDSQPSNEAIVWLKVELNPSGNRVLLYYNTSTFESTSTVPSPPDVIVSLEDMSDRMVQLDSNLRALGQAEREKETSESQVVESVGPSSAIAKGGGDEAARARRVSFGGAEVVPTLESRVTRYGGEESVQLDNAPAVRREFFSHTANAGATFHPHRQPLRGDGSHDVPKRMPGRMPWLVVKQATTVIVVAWVVGLFYVTLSMFVNDELPEIGGGEEEMQPILVSAGPWPHDYFTPRSLACHPLASNTVLIAEAYAVYEVDLRSLDSAQGPPRIRRAFTDCLARAPAFHARGIRSISIECHNNAALYLHEAGTSADGSNLTGCFAVLFGGVDGDEALRCAFDSGGGSDDTAVHNPVRVHGGPWQALAGHGGAGSFWAVRARPGRMGTLANTVVVRLSGRHALRHKVDFMPDFEIPRNAWSNVSHLHVHRALTHEDGGVGVKHNGHGLVSTGALLGLEGNGVLRAFPLTSGGGADAPQAWLLRAVGVSSWTGLCSLGHELLFVGTSPLDARPGAGATTLWRMPLPPALQAGAVSLGAQEGEVEREEKRKLKS